MDLPPAPRGMPQIEVTFDIDANGIVQVSAKDKATNKEQQIRIQASGGLSDEDIEKMVQEAEANAEEDKARREMIETKNQADGIVHSTEKNLQEHGDKVSAEEKTAIETDLAAVKQAMEGEDAEDLKAKLSVLLQSSMKLGEAAYKAQAETPEAQGAESEQSQSTQEDTSTVVDAEFEDLDENNRKKA